MSEKHKQVCGTLNYYEHFLVFVSVIRSYTSISAFASLAGVSVGIVSPTTGIKICAITTAIKKCKSVNKKKRKNQDKIVFLAKNQIRYNRRFGF